jgi:MFS family permease
LNSLWGPTLVAAMLVTGLGLVPLYLLTTQLPSYVMRLGGSALHVGTLVTAATLASMVSRPFAGFATDRYGARFVVGVGAAVLLIGTMGMAGTARPESLVMLMMLIGAGGSAMSTAAGAVVAAESPPERRGEAMSLYAVFTHVPIAVGPALGAFLSRTGGMAANFSAIAGLAIVVAVLGLPMRGGRSATPGGFGLGGRPARLGAVLLLLLYVGYSVMFAFLPLHAAAAGIANVGWFFTLYSVLMISFRMALRQAPDRLGRHRLLTGTMTSCALAYFVLAVPPTRLTLVGAAVILALSVSVLTPTLLAFVIDRTPETQRGRAIGFLLASTDLGSAVGGMSAGALVRVTDAYAAPFVFGGVMALVAALVFLVAERGGEKEGTDLVSAGAEELATEEKSGGS